MIRTRTATMIGAMLALALGMPACAYLFGSWGGRAAAPALRDGVIFSHKKHVVDEGVACGDCHGAVGQSTSLSSARFLPSESTCMDCHEKKPDTCKMCHSNPQAPSSFLDTRMDGLRFDHKAHVERGTKAGDKDACERCHSDIKHATKISEDRRPAMFGACSSCHKQDFRKEDCQQCHERLVDRPDRPLTIFDHGNSWMQRHGSAAKGGATVCGHCHQESTCAECHSRNAPMVPSLLRLDKVGNAQHHRGDFMSRHAIEAKLDGNSCTTCHAQSTCNSCHTRMGIAQTGDAKGQVLNLGPHPQAWMEPGAATSHGKAARRDALACAACHDQGASSNCVDCHKSGAPGGNPHPPGWSSQLEKATAPACAPCHK